MSDVWLITRSLTDEIASTFTLDDIKKLDANSGETSDREIYYDSFRIKIELEKLGISCSLIPAKNLISEKNQPKLIMDCYHTFDLNRHIENLKLFENHNVKIINKPDVHKMCGDKSIYYARLKRCGISTIKSLHIPLPISYESILKIETQIGYPIVIKPINGVKGRGVTKCNTEDDIWDACLSMYDLPIKTKSIIAEKWIDHRIIGTIRVYMIGGNIVSCMQRKPDDEIDFFISNSPKNSIRIPYQIDHKLTNICKLIYQALDKIDIATIDFLHDGNDYLPCDINSPGGFKGFENHLDINIGKLIANYIGSKL